MQLPVQDRGLVDICVLRISDLDTTTKGVLYCVDLPSFPRVLILCLCNLLYYYRHHSVFMGLPTFP